MKLSRAQTEMLADLAVAWSGVVCGNPSGRRTLRGLAKRGLAAVATDDAHCTTAAITDAGRAQHTRHVISSLSERDEAELSCP